MVEIITSLNSLTRVRQSVGAVATQAKHSGPIMMMYGPFMFAVDTAAYNTLSRSCSYRWSAQTRLGRSPTMQFSGPGEETVELEGSIFPEISGDENQIQTMREMAGLGEPLFLVDGQGRFYGRWVITSVSETLSIIQNNGAARQIQFRMSLTRYGEDVYKTGDKAKGGAA
ncbi:MAG: phage tail protein [Gammaproteobacteria bacterium]|nr:phage tail protein [Gammaproteobacteria bacterium]MDH5651690.1 phage tail protein [Gammaproteobacteria bacterium]